MHGYEPTREEAMTAFAKSWRRRSGHDENTRVKSGHLARLPFRDGELEWRKSDPPKNRPRRLAKHQRRRHPGKGTYLTADNQMTPKPNSALNAGN